MAKTGHEFLSLPPLPSNAVSSSTFHMTRFQILILFTVFGIYDLPVKWASFCFLICFVDLGGGGVHAAQTSFKPAMELSVTPNFHPPALLFWGLDLQTYPIMPSFMKCQGLNPGPHACRASALPSEPHSLPFILLFSSQENLRGKGKRSSLSWDLVCVFFLAVSQETSI